MIIQTPTLVVARGRWCRPSARDGREHRAVGHPHPWGLPLEGVRHHPARSADIVLWRWREGEVRGLLYKSKRGPLSKLMAEEKKQTVGIHELSYDFACRITRLFQYLTEGAEYKEYVISKQLYRSGTSIGANGRESRKVCSW